MVDVGYLVASSVVKQHRVPIEESSLSQTTPDFSRIAKSTLPLTALILVAHSAYTLDAHDGIW